MDRLCEAIPAVADPTTSCLTDQQAISDSNKVGSDFSSTALATNSVYYRVVVKVTGASNTESYVQVILPKQI